MTDHPEAPRRSGPLEAFVVDATLADALLVGQTLTAAGFRVTQANSFDAAKQHMAKTPPDVLVADICLGEYNGLHLVIRGKALRPDMAAIVTCDRADPVLELEAHRLGATFLVKPIVQADLLAIVKRTLFRGQGDPVAIKPPYERRIAERRLQGAEVAHHDRRQIQRRRDETVPVHRRG